PRSAVVAGVVDFVLPIQRIAEEVTRLTRVEPQLRVPADGEELNEELATVSQENRHRVDELSQLSHDLQNLLVSTDIATLFLDRELRIVRFTPQTEKLFNIRHTDRGRPLTDLTHHLEYPDIQADARRVLDRLERVEQEMPGSDGRWYLTRLVPYRTGDDRIDGVVVTFIDITERKRAEEESDKAKEYAESIVETLHEPLLVLHPDLTIKSVNAAFYDHFDVERDHTIGRKIYDLGNGQWNIPELRTLLEDVLPESNVFNDYLVSHDFESIGKRVMLLNARRLDHVQLILLGIRDITERHQFEAALRDADRRKDEFLATLAHELRNPLATIRSGIDVVKLAPEDTQLIRETCGLIEGQLAHLVALVDDLLEVSRIARG
ncbi:MAG: PAS domain-containing protein, partial [Planctomycetales bacterium]|nr:PAS domain-containing protein [Planctomycetales bacterium]